MQKKILPLLFVLLTATCFSQNAPGKRIVIDGTLSLSLSNYQQDERLTKALQDVNNKIVYVAIINTAPKKIPFAVSKYHSEAVRSIDSAFDQTVRFKAADDDVYKLVEAGTYKKDDKVLRYKISEITFDGGAKTNSVMYYFMKEDASNDLYEIKLSGNPKNRKELKAVLEQVALSVSFL
ncbi:MAG: hypothetical protein ACTHOF_08075 [Flavisolibacter sp.]